MNQSKYPTLCPGDIENESVSQIELVENVIHSSFLAIV